MAANFNNPYQSTYAKQQHGFDPAAAAAAAMSGGFPSSSSSPHSAQASSLNPAATNGGNEIAYPFAVNHSNQANAIPDSVGGTTVNMPQSYDHNQHHYHHQHHQPMDLGGLSANQVNQAFNNMAFSSSYGDLSARSSRRSNDMVSIGHHHHHQQHQHHHQQHHGHDLSSGHSNSHFGSNHHYAHHNDGGHNDEYSFDVNQISDLLNDNTYLSNVSPNSRPISKSDILSDLKSTIAPPQNNLLSSNQHQHHHNRFEMPLPDSIASAGTSSHHRDSNGTSADSPESNSNSTQYSPDNGESNCSSVQWVNSNGLNDLDGRIDAKRNKRHVPESSPSSYSSTHYIQPKRQFTNNFDLLEGSDLQYDSLHLNYENDHQNVANSSSPSVCSKSITFEMPLTTPVKGQSQAKGNSRVIGFTSWNIKDWVDLFTFDNKPIERPSYEVEADKGFYYSTFDEAFVCQKKNHFQITIRSMINEQPAYMKHKDDPTLHKIDKCYLKLYGVKEESHSQTIPIKQYDTDRKSTDYEPLECKLVPMEACKFTKKRLHFAHTTHNNNRKKNLPNPDQRYFLLVVEIEAITPGKQAFTLCSFASEKIIVRAVNPGQFKQDSLVDSDLAIQAQPSSISASPSTRISVNAPVVPNVKSPEEQLKTSQIKLEIPSIASPEVSLLSDQAHPMKLQQLSENISSNNLSHFGNFGINTTNPDEALTVVGNVKVLGNILQPSDYRVKENFKPIDENQALENVKKIQLYRYNYKKEFINQDDHDGHQRTEIGVIAQDLQRVLPDAIVQSGNTKLTSGEVVDNLLLVDKNRLNMECMGALKALGNKTENLDQKIVKLEEYIEKSAVISRAEATKGSQDGSKGGLLNNNNKPPAKGLAALSQYFWLSGDRKNSEHEKKLIRAYKILLTISLIVIALGIVGILVVLVVQHNHNLSSKQNGNQSSQSSDDRMNETYYYYYPVIAPPPISSPSCPPTKTCKYCCQYTSNDLTKSDGVRRTRSKTLPSSLVDTVDFFDKIIPDDDNLSDLEVQEVSETILNSTDFVFSNVMNNPITPDKSLLGIVLYSRDPFIFVNLSTNGNCNPPYCEKLNGVNYYFLPINQNVDLQTHFNLVFYLTNQYNLKYCNTDNNAQLCPNFKVDTVMFDTSKSKDQGPRMPKNTTTNPYDVNDYQFQANNIKQYAYLTPVSYFLHVDYIFRIYPSNSKFNIDVCIFKSSQYNPALSNLYQEYVFRFYRIC